MTVINESDKGWRAIADLGTNTFQWLIGKRTDGGTEIFRHEKVSVGLGKKGMSQKRFTSDAIERALEALQLLAGQVQEAGIHPSRVQLIGTSAFRNATNHDELIQAARQQFGFQIDVIQGNVEAELIFKGVLASGVLDNQIRSLIMDIGGGSVEFILCEGKKDVWKQSFELGGLRLMDLFHTHDPLPAENLKTLNDYLLAGLKPLWEVLEGLTPVQLVGSAGSFETLVEVRNASKGLPFGEADKLPVHTISASEFHRIYEQMLPLPLEERLKIPGMISLRAGMMVVALEFIRLLLGKTGSDQIYVSTYSLKEGVFFSSV